VLPLLGPATLRDTPTRIADNFLQPFYWYNAGNERWASLVLSTLDKRAQLLPLDSTLEGVFDQYAFIRDAYLQRRQFKVYDGNPPEEPLDDLVDPALEEEAAPGE
jgi:phospholipid-binding lipoprotein MlaA